MGATNSSDQKKLYYQLKQKATKEDKPAFALSEKVDGSWKVTQTYDTISGRINGLKIEEKDFGSGGKANVFTLLMEDDDNKFQIQMPHGSLTYSIINTLASDLDTISMYTIQVYRKESKKDGFTGYFAGAYIKCGEQQIKWKINPKEAPEGVKALNPDGTPFLSNGKPVVNYDNVKLFWEKFAHESIISKLSASGSQSQKPNPAPASSGSEASATADDDDLPF
jgi:hypothetical protein